MTRLSFLKPQTFTCITLVISLGMICSSILLRPTQPVKTLDILDRWLAFCIGICAIVFTHSHMPAAFPVAIEHPDHHCLCHVSQRIRQKKQDPFFLHYDGLLREEK